MNIAKRKKADPAKIAESLLIYSARIGVLVEAYKKVINLFNGDIEKASKNAFFKEHIAGSGFGGVSNQTGGSVDFVLRQAADKLGYKATEGNWGAIFVSGRALAYLAENAAPKKFSDVFHCEHTVQNNQRRTELVEWLLNSNTSCPSEIAKWIVTNTICTTVMNIERNDSGEHKNDNRYPFWRYKTMGIDVHCWTKHHGFIAANNLSLADIARIQVREDPLFSQVMDYLDEITVEQNRNLFLSAEDTLYNKGVVYHRIPKDLSIFVTHSEEELEEIHYTHRAKKREDRKKKKNEKV